LTEGSYISRGPEHTFIRISSVFLVWIPNRNKRLVLVSPVLNYPSQGNSLLLPQQLRTQLGHNSKAGASSRLMLAPRVSVPCVKRVNNYKQITTKPRKNRKMSKY